MKSLRLLAFLFSLSAIWGCATSRSENATREVRAVERRWLDAYESRDAEAMRNIMADDFVITYGDGGRQTRGEVLDFVSREKSLTNHAAPRFHTSNVAHDYGAVVVLIGELVTELPSGTLRAHYTDTYVRRHGRWQVVSSQLSRAE